MRLTALGRLTLIIAIVIAGAIIGSLDIHVWWP